MTRAPVAHHARRGTALVMALLILAGMMLLGLPFLFSQSSSLAGARSFQAQQAAHIYAESARNLGSALATYAVDDHWRAGGKQLHTALEQYLATSFPTVAPAPGPVQTNHLDLDPSGLGLNQTDSRVRVGLAIEDESGKLDANSLSAQGWDDLLKLVGIPDWDDDYVDINWPAYNYGPDGDLCGELADALAHYRLWRSTYTRLEDLLEVDPQNWRGNRPEYRKRLTRAELERLRPYLSFHNLAPGRRGLIDLGTVVAVDDISQLQNPPPPARFYPQQVWTDIADAPVNDGTWLEVEAAPGDTVPRTAYVRRTRIANSTDSTWNITYDVNQTNNQPSTNAALLIAAPPPLNLHQLPQALRGLPAYKGALTPADGNFPASTPGPAWPITFYGLQKPDPNDATKTVNVLPLPYLLPRYQPDPDPAFPPRFAQPRPQALSERQPLDISSGAAVTIEHAATVVDPLGNPIAQESRRTVLQAVPQESVLERRWETQGQLQPLIDQRYGSRMVTWPMPTARATDVRVDDVDPTVAGATAAAETGVGFAINQTLASTDAGHKPTHVAVQWQAKLGSVATTKDKVLDDNQSPSGLIPQGAVFAPPTADQDPVTHVGLYPDGIRLGAGTQIAYRFARDNKGPLTWNAPAATPVDSTMGHRSLSVWIKPESDWLLAGEVVTILESRTASAAAAATGLTHPTDPTDLARDNAQTNYFGVLYDPGQNMLVATYGTPGYAYAPPDLTAANDPAKWLITGWTMAMDDLTTAGVDERCWPGTAPLVAARMLRNECAAWSPVYLPNRILTCYKLGRREDGTVNKPEPGRWYHLQVTIGNGRPGGMGIILDGIAGADVGLMTADAYYNQRKTETQKGPRPGDHLTLPSLVLVSQTGGSATTALAAISRPMTSPTTDLFRSQITVAMPGFAPFAAYADDYSGTPPIQLDPQKILPRRGSVLIGDEYVRYQDITGTGSGLNATWQLVACTRGDRQDSYTYFQSNPAQASDALQREPMTANHAVNSRVLPDGCRLTPAGSGDLFTGRTTSKVDFVNVPLTVRADGVLITHITGPVGAAPFPVDATVFTLGVGWQRWPQRGYCRVNQTSGPDFYAYFTLQGDQLTLAKQVDHAPLGMGPPWKEKLPGAPGHYVTYNRANLAGSDTLANNITGTTTATVTLVSLQVDDQFDKPLADTTGQWQLPYGEWDHGTANPHARPMFQILDPATGRCEWIRYTDIVRADDGEAYFIDRNGWNWNAANPNARSRAQERSPFSLDVPFPAGSLILPVQTGIVPNGRDARSETNLHAWCKMLSPGDLVTFVPRNYTTQPAPTIAAVRYACNDGYDGTLDLNNDTVNGHFALTDQLQVGSFRNSQDWEIVMGSGLNTQLDLTPNGTVVMPPAALPRLDAHEVGGPARLVFGAPDPERGPPGAGPSALIMSIDAPVAIAPKPNPDPQSTFAGKVRRVIRDNACATDGIRSGNDLPLIVEFDKPLFQGQERMGLVEIGGEVFAWRRPTADDQQRARTALLARQQTFPGIQIPNLTANPANAQTDDNWARFCTLVGRGLLNSSQAAHPVDLSPAVDQLSAALQSPAIGGNLDHGEDAMRLPIGPVRTLLGSQDFNDNTWFAVAEDGSTASRSSFIAPAVLVTQPLGDPQSATPQSELMQLAGIDTRTTIPLWNSSTGQNDPFTNLNCNKWIVAQWLRGLYNTPIGTAWAPVSGGNDMVQPLLIGWWTRYPSALPQQPPVAQLVRAAQLRSRAFPWIGFSMRLARARFDDAAMPFQVAFDNTLTTNKVLDGTDGNLDVEVRAMAGAVDGSATAVGALRESTVSLGDWNLRAFKQLSVSTTGLRPVTGLFDWNVAGKPNETDGVEVRLSFRYRNAPSARLDDIARAANRAPLIGGARLQCHAPITVLASEEAR